MQLENCAVVSVCVVTYVEFWLVCVSVCGFVCACKCVFAMSVSCVACVSSISATVHVCMYVRMSVCMNFCVQYLPEKANRDFVFEVALPDKSRTYRFCATANSHMHSWVKVCVCVCVCVRICVYACDCRCVQAIQAASGRNCLEGYLLKQGGKHKYVCVCVCSYVGMIVCSYVRMIVCMCVCVM